jgi:hypothetical protein
MRKALFYGIHPGGLQVLSSSRRAEGARPLFRKYTPLIRTIAKAGWQPITCAEDRAGIAKVERWGDPAKVTYFTVRPAGDEGGTVELAVDLASLGLTDADLTASELVEGRDLTTTRDADALLITVPIESEETLLLELSRGE